MNAMIRVVKGTLATLALAGVGLLLRWFTAGSISGLRTYDLDSLTVLAVGTIAWIAYGWLVLAVLLTVLEQIPGAIGTLAGAVAGRITTKTARALLRSGLGVAAVTPLTISAAQATPTDTAHIRQWTQPASDQTNYQATEPRSQIQFDGTASPATHPQSGTHPDTAESSYRASEPHSQVQLGATSSPATQPQSGTQDGTAESSYRATEPRSQVPLGDTSHRATQPQSGAQHGSAGSSYRAIEPRSQVQFGDASEAGTEPRSGARHGGSDTSYRATEPASTVEIGGATSDQGAHDFRATEPASSMQIGPEADLHRTNADSTAPDQHADDYRATEPRSTVELGNSAAASQTDTDYRATEPPSKMHLGSTPTPADDHTTPGTTEPGHPTTTTPTPNRSRSSDRPAVPGDSTGSKPQQTGAARRTDGPTDRPTVGPARVGVPDRPTDGAPTRYTELRATVPVRVVVREGDSLWSIAARELGPGATTEAIAARWPDWYAANRHVIGDDPDLILPGQVLRIPPHHQEQ